jgi:D-3-phosphoglycerate dehydrogenase
MGYKIGLSQKRRLKEINLNYSGELAQYDTTAVTLALVKGLLSPILKDTINFVNSVSLAKERGIKINETKSTKEEEFVNSIQLHIITDKEIHLIVGTLSPNRLARIVKIDNYYVEITPQGQMIVIYNWDRPGIIGNLGTLLGSHNINIASMTFGRESPGGKAISVLNVDSPVSEEILKKIEKLENILKVKLINI